MSRYSHRRPRGLVTDRRVVLTTAGILAVAGGALFLRPDTSDAAARRNQGTRNVVCQPVDGAQATASPSAGAAQQQAQRPGRGGCPAGTRPVFVNVANTQAAGQSGGNAGQDAAGGQQAGTGQNGTGQGDAAQNGGQNGGQAGQQNGGQNGGQNNNGQNGGQNGVGAEPTPAEGTNPADTTTPAANQIVNPTSTQAPVGQQQNNDGRTPPAQDFLGNNCNNSRLQPHDGFQNGNRCVSTAFGEVATADNNPSLIISSAPRFVRANQAFDLRVNTRNLVRDRFLAAAQGGYYKESSFLDAQGLTRGHFHTACRMLSSGTTAPDPAPAPAFFAATEDGKGGRDPDTVTVRVTGLPRGEAQCAVWAGDGSHRVPMMQRANQIPAFDVVRISVR